MVWRTNNTKWLMQIEKQIYDLVRTIYIAVKSKRFINIPQIDMVTFASTQEIPKSEEVAFKIHLSLRAIDFFQQHRCLT